MKITQLAIYVPDQNKAMENFEKFFGKKMDVDESLATGMMENTLVNNLALKMLFNFDIIEGFGIEFIHSEDTRHWHKKIIREKGNVPFLSHIAIFCETDKEYVEGVSKFEEMGVKVLQHTISHDHSSLKALEEKDPRLAKDYTGYTCTIFNCEKLIGFNIELYMKNFKKTSYQHFS